MSPSRRKSVSKVRDKEARDKEVREREAREKEALDKDQDVAVVSSSQEAEVTPAGRSRRRASVNNKLTPQSEVKRERWSQRREKKLKLEEDKKSRQTTVTEYFKKNW